MLKIIENRRSIRKYTGDKISDEIIQKILKTAMYSPSAHNSQCWEFIVVRNQEMKEAFAKSNSAAHMAPKAPVVIVVCGNLTRPKLEHFWIQDCAAATQTLLLAAHILGLGSVWHGIYPNKEHMKRIQQMLHLPNHIIPFSLIPLGKSAEAIKHPNRFHPEYIHYEQWD